MRVVHGAVGRAGDAFGDVPGAAVDAHAGLLGAVCRGMRRKCIERRARMHATGRRAQPTEPPSHARPSPVRPRSPCRSGRSPIHWYGLTYLVAFGLFLLLAARRVRLPQFAARRLDPARRRGPAVLRRAGRGHRRAARLRAVLQAGLLPGAIRSRSSTVWKGGMSFHGGLLGVIAAMAWFARSRRRAFLEVTDLVAPCVPTGLAAGRIGNFINGELWGRAADPALPWAMVFPQSRQRRCRAIRRSCTSSRWKACCCSRCCGCTRAARARARPGVGRLPGRLRRAALHRRVLPRARQLPRPAGAAA